MSVQFQIDRLNAIKQRIRTNLVAQGITVPEDTMLDAMAEQILAVAGISPTVTLTEFSNSAGSGVNINVNNGDGTGDTLPIYNGKNGTSVTVSSVSESFEDGGSNVVNFSDGNKLTVKNGKAGSPGDPGYSPVRGEDYWTEADQADIVQQVLLALGGNPIFGVVDEDNNIIVSGNLPDGTYSVKYELEDGSTVNIGNLVLDSNVYYSVTSNLTNCSSNNTATQAIGGQSYSATITAKSGYELKTLTVTMGGNPVTVSGGVIDIDVVDGDIVITAVAEAVQAAEPTNFADPSSNDWANKTRISNSSSTGISPADYDHMHVTNYIPVQAGDIITLGNCATYSSTIPNARFAAYSGTSHSTRLYNDAYKTANNYMTWTADNKFTVMGSDVKYVRFTIFNVTDVNAVTINIQRNGAYL